MNSDMLTFCFKGDRTYVHGPDICASLSDHLCSTLDRGSVQGFNILLHKLARKNLRLETLKNQVVANRADAAATVTFSTGADRYVVFCIESDQPIACRIPYPEQRIVIACALDAPSGGILLERRFDFTLFQVLVAMTKALHQALFPDVRGKWFFTRLQTEELLPSTLEYRQIRITLQQNLNLRLTKCEIQIDGRPRGHIFFSLVAEGR